MDVSSQIAIHTIWNLFLYWFFAGGLTMSQCVQWTHSLYLIIFHDNVLRALDPTWHNRPLTHWGRDKMDAISQTTLSNAFSWMTMLGLRLEFHWNVFLRVQFIIFQHWFRYWLGADQATSHYLNQWWFNYRRIYASLGLNELMSSL